MKKIILLSILFILSTQLWAQSNLAYLDTTFNISGPVKGDKYMAIGGGARALAIDAQGRIVMAACSANYSMNIYVFRLKPDGSFDKPFSTDSIAKIPLSTFGISYGHCTSLVIQKDGKYLIGGNDTQSNNMILIRLNSDGTLDKTFDTDGLVTLNLSAGYDVLSDIAIQSTGQIIVSGTSSSKITVIRLNSDGSIETGFASYLSTNTLTETASGLEISNDTIVIGGSYYNSATTPATYYYSAIKLAPTGSLLWRKDISFTASAANIGDVAIQTDGRIIVAGAEYAGFRAYRLNSDGQIDASFAGGIFIQSVGMGVSLRSVVLENDGKVDFIGSYGGNYLIMRTDQSGNFVTSFGTSGQLSINTTRSPSNVKGMLSQDQKLLITGDAYTASEIIKVVLNPVIHIIGKAYALPNSFETYKIEIPSTMVANNYQWTYTGKYVNYVPNQTSYPLTLLFSDSATSGKLTCALTSSAGVPLGTGEIDIIINKTPSNANQLAKPTCLTNLNDCSLGYIDNFTLNTLNNINSGCSANGYSDYTQSDFTDTLAAGGVYSAKLKIPNDGTFTSYVGIWIDYNNDGNFSNIDEFVGEAYGNDTKVMVDIFLKNREGYDGPKRLRVRSRPDVKINSTDACPAGGEKGETEDYLILLQKQPSLEAPQIITPNEDGLNDYFVIHGVDPNKKNKLTIFDRIGEVKFQSSNYENNWNGTDKNGTKLSPGTYYYVFTNEKNSIKGFVEIRY